VKSFIPGRAQCIQRATRPFGASCHLRAPRYGAQGTLALYGVRGGAGVGTMPAGNGQLPSYGGQFGTASSAGG